MLEDLASIWTILKQPHTIIQYTQHLLKWGNSYLVLPDMSVHTFIKIFATRIMYMNCLDVRKNVTLILFLCNCRSWETIQPFGISIINLLHAKYILGWYFILRKKWAARSTLQCTYTPHWWLSRIAGCDPVTDSGQVKCCRISTPPLASPPPTPTTASPPPSCLNLSHSPSSLFTVTNDVFYINFQTLLFFQCHVSLYCSLHFLFSTLSLTCKRLLLEVG